jgi:hypothetical protein
MPYKTTFHELAHVLLGHTAESEQADSEITPRNLREARSYPLRSVDPKGVECCRGYIQACVSGIRFLNARHKAS